MRGEQYADYYRDILDRAFAGEPIELTVNFSQDGDNFGRVCPPIKRDGEIGVSLVGLRGRVIVFEVRFHIYEPEGCRDLGTIDFNAGDGWRLDVEPGEEVFCFLLDAEPPEDAE